MSKLLTAIALWAIASCGNGKSEEAIKEAKCKDLAAEVNKIEAEASQNLPVLCTNDECSSCPEFVDRVSKERKSKALDEYVYLRKIKYNSLNNKWEIQRKAYEDECSEHANLLTYSYPLVCFAPNKLF